jgi:hypothetical protein
MISWLSEYLAALAGFFYFLFDFFAENSVKTFINSAIAYFHFMAVARRTTAGANKAVIRKVSGSFAAKRRCNRPA